MVSRSFASCSSLGRCCAPPTEVNVSDFDGEFWVPGCQAGCSSSNTHPVDPSYYIKNQGPRLVGFSFWNHCLPALQSALPAIVVTGSPGEGFRSTCRWLMSGGDVCAFAESIIRKSSRDGGSRAARNKLVGNLGGLCRFRRCLGNEKHWNEQICSRQRIFLSHDEIL